MFLDASAVVAILTDEEDATELDARIRGSSTKLYYSDIVRFEAAQAIARVRAREQAVTLKMKPETLWEAWKEVTLFFP